jgi:3'(2'), 5'-bisphosphate nucleotidase
MRPTDHSKLEAVLRALALEAGAAIMAVRAAASLGTRAKADDSPVTEADLAADAIIRAGLAAALPGFPVVTEEAAESHLATPPERFLLVDPLDGTKEFVHGEADFTVNIALVEGGVPVRGVVHAPAHGRLWITDRDGASWEEDPHAGTRRRLRVGSPDNDALVVVASRSHRDAALEAWIAQLRVARSAAAGSSLKFCLVAAGEADLYPRLGRTMEWDTAAGQAVLAGAGGVTLRLPDLAPLTCGKPGWENPHFVAMAPGVVLPPG